MSARADRSELPPAKRRRLLGLRLLRALATTVMLVALYYLLPLDHIKNVPLTLVAGLLILLAVTVWQVRAIIRARYPALRAVEALAATVPLFLLLFASAYFTMAKPSTPGSPLAGEAAGASAARTLACAQRCWPYVVSI